MRSNKYRFSKSVVLSAMMGISGAAGVSAAELHLKESASGSWTNAANYVENAAPAVGDTILITAGSPVLDGSTDFRYSLNVTGGNFTNSGNFYFGNGSAVTINIPNGNATFGNTVRIGGAAVSGASGSVMNIIDGNVAFKSYLAVGRTEDGTFNQSGGKVTHSVCPVVLGDLDGRKGIMNISGGTFESNQNFLIGASAKSRGELNLTGGTLTTTAEANVGNASGAVGKILIDGASASGTFKALNIGSGSGSSGIVEVKNGTMKITESVTVGANANASAELNISGGTVTIPNLTVKNSGTAAISGGKTTVTTGNVVGTRELIISGGENTFTTLNISDSAKLNITGGTANIASLNVSGTSAARVAGSSVSGSFNLTGNSQTTLDGANVSATDIWYVAENSVMNLVNGAKLSMGSKTLRLSNDKNLGTATLNIIDGELNSNTWIGIGWGIGDGVVNVFSDGILRHTNASTHLAVGDGTNGTLNLWGGSVLESKKIRFFGKKGLINFVPTTENWTFEADDLVFTSTGRVSFGNLDGITAFNKTSFEIAMPNAGDVPNIEENGYWNVSFDTSSKTLKADLNNGALEWNTFVDAPQASLDNGESGLLNLAEIEGNSFSLFVRGEGDGNALADYFTESLELFDGLDQENGKFTYDELGLLTYSGLTDLPNYFYWDLAAFNAANGSSLHFGGVPEPSTVLLLLVGLAGIGLLRRKKSVA